MNHKDKMLDWIKELETYAKEQGLSMRILDSIEECKNHIVKEDLSWQELRQQLEEVMESVGLKTQQTDMAAYSQNKNNVSVEKVQTQVRRMAEDCHRENLDSASAIAEKKNLNVKECIRKMNEISHTEAYFDEMIDEKRYMDFFQRVKNSYEKDMSKVTEEMVDDISDNYNHMADHMRSMFQSIDGYIDGVGNEAFYREYESRNAGIRDQVISEVHTADFGGSAVTGFADKTKNVIHKITKKIRVKKTILSIVPIIIIILLFVLSIYSVIKTVSGIAGDIANICESFEIDNNVINNLQEIDQLYQSNKDLPDELIDTIESMFKIVKNLKWGLLYFIVIYIFYLWMLKKWCKHCICKECSKYLHTELAMFEQKDEIRKKVDETITQIVSDCEQQYLVILNRIFAGTKYEEKDTEQVSGFDDLQRKWNQLKYN